MIYVVLAIPYGVALALLVAELTGFWVVRRISLPRLRPVAWVAIILVTYVAQLLVIHYAATHAPPHPLKTLGMPLPVVDSNSSPIDFSEAVLLVCGFMQSCAMIALFRDPPSRRSILIGAFVLILLSLSAPALTSADIYLSVGYALLGMTAHAPPHHAFGPDFIAINHWWRVPIPPAPYGPVWLLVDQLVTMALPTLLGKLLALRIFCAALLVLLGILMRALGLPERYAIAVWLNPGLTMQFVTNAHNDIFALTLIVAAALSLRYRRVLAGIALLILVGLIKLPFAVLGLPVLSTLATPLQRYGAIALVIACVSMVSWVAGGPQYVHALESHSAHMSASAVWHAFAVVIGLILLGCAILRKRRYLTGVWALPWMGAWSPFILLPWYLAWSFPYALGRHRVLAYLLVWFPFASVLIDPLFLRAWTILLVFPLVLVAALASARLRRVDRLQPPAVATR
jgi:hypothetical protein